MTVRSAGHVASPPTTAERLAGGIWGVLVGDAAGVPYEFMPASSIGQFMFGRPGGYHNVPPGTWSDDGALTLASLDSLLACGFDPDDMAKRFLTWRDAGAYTPDGRVFDIGNTTSASLARYAAGVRPASACGGRDIRQNGNGSLMRILPLALASAGRTPLPAKELIRRAHVSSAVTHGHSRSQVACALYVLIARSMLAGATPAAARAAGGATLRQVYDAYTPRTRDEYLASLEHLLGGQYQSGGGTAWDAFHSAWRALIGAKSYAQVIERAIALGGDTDTTAAIAGGLAGIRWGIDGIPIAWLNSMRGRDLAGGLVRRLLLEAS